MKLNENEYDDGGGGGSYLGRGGGVFSHASASGCGLWPSKLQTFFFSGILKLRNFKIDKSVLKGETYLNTTRYRVVSW